MSHAGVTSAGQGSYLDSPVGIVPADTSRGYCTSNPKKQFNRAGQSIPALVTKDAPIPTNRWWSSLVFRRWASNAESSSCLLGNTLYANPAAFSWHSRGLGITYQNQVSPAVNTGIANFSGQGYDYLAPTADQHDLYAGSGYSSGSPSQELQGTTLQVTDWSDWTVESVLSNASGNSSVRAIIGRGLPITWFESFGSGSGPGSRIHIPGPYTQISNVDGTLIVTVKDRTYIAWAPYGQNWTPIAGSNAYRSATGWFAIAAVPEGTDPVALAERWRTFAYSPVTNTTIDYTYDQNASTVTTNYRVEVTRKAGSGSTTGTVMALFPHHERQRTDTSQPISATFNSPRGKMTILEDVSGFTTTDTFHGIVTELPALTTGTGKSDHSQALEYLNAVQADPLNQAMVNENGDATYWTGKAVGRAARIVEVADQMAQIPARNTALNAIRETLTDWFSAYEGKTHRVFAYSEDFGTLLGYPAGPNGSDQYGSLASLNDHHFHYGYYVAAAATLARFDPQWAHDYGDMVTMLIRDAASPDRDDPLFPYLRNFDVYAGHSWASGDGGDRQGPNQESSSEAINLAQAMIQWGEITADRPIRDAGIFLYTTETRAIEDYWFNGHGDFPSEVYHKNYASMVLGSGAHYSLWFGGANDHEFFYGINMLPITGGSLYLGTRPELVDRTYAEFTESNTQPEPKYWHDILYSYRALSDANAARNSLTTALTNQSFGIESGESLIHTFNWITSLTQLGNVDASVRANYPMAAAFNRDGERSYVVTNISNQDIEVTFTSRNNHTTKVSAAAGQVTVLKSDGTIVTFGDGSSGGQGLPIQPSPDDSGGSNNPDPNEPTTPIKPHPGPPATNVKQPSANPTKQRAQMKIVRVKVNKPARTGQRIKRGAKARITIRATTKDRRKLAAKVQLVVGNKTIAQGRFKRTKAGVYVAKVTIKKARNTRLGKIRVKIPKTPQVKAAVAKTSIRVVR